MATRNRPLRRNSDKPRTPRGAKAGAKQAKKHLQFPRNLRRLPVSADSAAIVAMAVRRGKSWSIREQFVSFSKRKPIRFVQQEGWMDFVAELLASAGHPTRLRILLTLMTGPSGYRELCNVTSLASGPLYHHINQLRMAEMIILPRRNQYQITKTGEIAFVSILAWGELMRRTTFRG